MAKIEFVNGDPAHGVLGTVVTAEFLNALGISPLITNPIRTATISGSVDKDADFMILVDCSAGPVNLALPAIADVQSMRRFKFKKTDATANVVTITPSGAETIDGEANVQLILKNEKVEIASDGTGWQNI